MTVAEDFVMLALKEDDGRWLIGHLQLECGLVAAVLVELAQDGRIDLDGEVVVVRDAAPVGLPQEDAVLARIETEDEHDLRWWVESLRRGLSDDVLARLVAGGAVVEHRARRFGVFSELRYPLTDPASRRAVRERLSVALDGGPADARSFGLLAIAHATGLDPVLFPGTDPADVERAIEAGMGDDAIGDAVTKVVQHVLAVLVAVLAAVTAAM